MFEFLKEKWAWSSEKRALSFTYVWNKHIKRSRGGLCSCFHFKQHPNSEAFQDFCVLNNTGSYSSIVNDFGFSAVLLSQKILVSILNFDNRLKDWHFADHFSWAETKPDFFVSIVNWNMSISSCFFNLLAVKSPPTKNWSKRFFLWIISEMQKVQA